MKISVLAASFAALAMAGAAGAQDLGEPRSYSTSWQDHGSQYRAVMFPHEINGCKIMLQSLRDVHGVLIERTGADCDCDLVIDEMSHIFRPATGYTADKLYQVCTGPGVDGATRKAEIMRESLKQKPDFAKMENVAPLVRDGTPVQARNAPDRAPGKPERKLRYQVLPQG